MRPAPLAARVEDFFTRVLAGREGFEVRRPQLEMAQAVARAFEEDELLVVEAGTGTGKSLGYLVPALFWLEDNDGPVVISTRTLNLQDQLLQKDLPDLRRFLGRGFSAVLAKGWSNYLCLRRLHQLPGAGELDGDDLGVLGPVQHRLEQGVPGERQHLVVEEGLWNRLAADPMACSRQHCSFFGECYFFKARRAMEQANLIVTNHSLLLADLSVRLGGGQGILPDYSRLIVDEAHHLEEVATEHLGHGAGHHGLSLLLQRLHRAGGRAEEGGLLPALRARVARTLVADARAAELLRRIDHELLARLVDLREGMQELAEAAAGLVQEGRYRLQPGFPVDPGEQRLFQAGQALVLELRHWIATLRQVSQSAQDHEVWTAQDSLALELSGLLTRLQSQAGALEFCLFPDSGDWIYWAEANKRDSGLAAVPLDVSRILANELFARLRTVVMTSATLAVKKRTHFFERRVGLGLVQERVTRLCLESPFDFASQAFLGLATDLGDPSGEAFVARAAPSLIELVLALGGRTFLLVTSYHQLKAFARHMRRPLEDQGVELLLQGHAPAGHLLQQFRSPGRWLLVGTDAFWEGVDVPGDALRCVVLSRLPFRVPTDPVVEARSRLLEAQGKSAFDFLQLPQAILKLRQGFGRLIRTSSDRGLVYILDGRIRSKAYGQAFLDSLPPCTRASGSLQDLVDSGLDWLATSPAAVRSCG